MSGYTNWRNIYSKEIIYQEMDGVVLVDLRWENPDYWVENRHGIPLEES